MPKFVPPKCHFFRDSTVGCGVIKARHKCMKKSIRLLCLPSLVLQTLAGSVSCWPSRGDRSSLIHSAENGVKCQARASSRSPHGSLHQQQAYRIDGYTTWHSLGSKGLLTCCIPAAPLALAAWWWTQASMGIRGEAWGYQVGSTGHTAPTGVNINARSKMGAEHFRRAFTQKKTKINGSFA